MDGEMLISEAFEKYRVEVIIYKNQSAKTEEMSRLAMKSLLKFIGHDIPVSELSFEIIHKWKRSLEKTLSRNTVRGYLLKIRVVVKHLNYCGCKNIINHEVIGLPKRQSVLVSFLTEREVGQMIKAAYTKSCGCSGVNRLRNRAIIALFYASGIRLSELLSMNIGDIRSDNSFTVVGKNDKPRLCFIDDRAASYIKSYLAARDDDCPALFICDKTQKRISKSVVQFMVRNAAKKAGIQKDVHPHTFRHSFATNLLRNNANLLYVRDFLGHESVQTTEMYTHVVNEDLRKIYVEKHTI